MQRKLFSNPFIYILISLLILTGIVFAGSLTPNAAPTQSASGMYTLTDLYNLIVNNTTTTAGNGILSTSTAATATTSHSISEIYARLANLVNPSNLKPASIYLGVTAGQPAPASTTILYSLFSTTSSPASSGYTLDDIYNLISNATTTAGNHNITNASSPTGTMHTLAQIYDALISYGDTHKSDVLNTTTYLGTLGTYSASTVPEAPTIGTATAGNALATVLFTPGANGGATVDYYTASSSPGGINVATTSTTGVVVTGLSNGTAYTFRVYAHNSVGTSTASGASNSVTPVAPSLSVAVLVVAGGGEGGVSGFSGGGGGAGGVISTTSFAVSGAQTVTVGNGGNGTTRLKGQNSVFGSLTAIGGGAGGATAGLEVTDYNGGSGGGQDSGPVLATPGTGTSGQGYNGGNGNGGDFSGGGGGAGAVGGNANMAELGPAGNGGDGISSSISGTATYYGGGGGGSSGGLGGQGGGGNARSGDTAPVAGTPNTGGGGGGSSYQSTIGEGGSGIVIVRYLSASGTATGGDITTDGAYKVHTFTTSGTFTVTAVN